MKRLALLLALVLSASAAAASPPTRYSLAGGCWTVGDSGPLRLKAAALGEYLLMDAGGKLLAGGGGQISRADSVGQDGIWRASQSGSAFAFTTAGGASLSGAVAPATGCPEFPEVALGATGTPARGASPLAGVKGVLDQHAHLMAFEFLGGDFHCGRPWSAFGVTAALPDCASIQGPQGSAAPVQNFLDFGEPEHPHDTVGWPTFYDWPTHHTLSYEQTYYRWLQRAWMGGLRIIETNMVDNEVLCRALPMKHTTCNDMDSVRLQTRDLFALQDYVDAQSGGPGRGWLRIVTSPYQARRVINRGKLAVVMGIEVSRIFGCGVSGGVPGCTTEQVDAGLDEVHRLGIRTFFPVHKFDNAFGGTKMDGGPIGVLINAANKEETGSFWKVQTCTTPETDNDQIAPSPGAAELLQGPLASLAQPGTFPAYPATPHCNTEGLTSLGEHVLRGMMKRHFLIEIDHMSGRTAQQALSIVEAEKYSGVMSSHSWDNALDNPRIRRVGGVVAPYAGSSTGFAAAWKLDRLRNRSRRFPYGLGYGADMNGLGAQGPPRPDNVANPVGYPFKSGDGAVTFERQVSGSHTYDVNRDGVAHYGLMPDWLEDLRVIAGPQITKDLFNGAESYLEMWERAEGVPGPSCPRGAVTRRGVGRVRLGMAWKAQLRAAGQPWSRPGRSFRWCHGAAKARVGAHFARGRVALAGRRGARVPARIARAARPIGAGLRAAPAGAGRRYLLRGSRSVAVASRALSRRSPRALRRALRAAGL